MIDLVKDGSWNEQLTTKLFPEDMEKHILEKHRPLFHSEEKEKLRWIIEST